MTFWTILGALLVHDLIQFIIGLLEPDEPINIIINNRHFDEEDDGK